MKTLKVLSYQELEEMTVEHLKENAFLTKPLKGDFTLYLVNTLPYYGVVVSVVFEERIIYRDVQLHYSWCQNTTQAVNKMLERAEKKILTDAELTAPLEDYGDYRNRIDFINNIAPKKWKHLSMFAIKERSEEEKQFIKNGYACGIIGFCYFEKEEHADYIKTMYKSIEELHREKMQEEEYFRGAVSYELANHEAGYTGESEEALRSLGLKYEKLPANFQGIVDIEHSKLMNQIY